VATMAKQRICVTGASGKAGRSVVRDLLEHGYDVVATDVASSKVDVEHGAVRADLTDYGQAIQVLKDVDAVVHLANIPAPGIYTPAVTFNTNMAMNFNVFHAAASCGLSRVVWALSETTLGLPFTATNGLPPRYAPVDEDHYRYRPRRTHCRRSRARRSPITSRSGRDAVRSASLLQHHGSRRLQAFPSMWRIHTRASGTCGATSTVATSRAPAAYPDGALGGARGSPGLIIAAADTVMNRPSAALFGEVFLVCRSLATSGSSRRCSPSTAPARSSATNPSLLARSHFRVLTAAAVTSPALVLDAVDRSLAIFERQVTFD